MSSEIIYILFSILMILAFPIYFKIAEKYKIVDVPNERSSHNYITIRGAGILLILSYLFFLIDYNEALFLSIGCTLAAIVGNYDDRITLKASTRLALYSLSVILVFYQLNIYQNIQWYMVLLFFIIALGVINTYNFMDGINGITGLYSTVIVLTAFAFDYYISPLDWFTNTLPFVLIYLLIFGFFNYRSRAKTFLGDAGSISLGLFAVFFVLLLIKKTEHFGFIAFLAVYGVDSVGTIILRILRRENIFEAHRSHLYQDMTNIVGHSHIKVAIAYATTQLVINVIWLYNFKYQIISPILLAIWVFLPLIGFYLAYKQKHKQLKFN